jgi:3',5'-cyclic AMP phosphodiesterase CpdA
VPARSLLATSDLHVTHKGNAEVVDQIRPYADGDWLIVAGDIAETASAIEETLKRLVDRFEKVLWTPGNHELWTMPDDPVKARGQQRYEYLVERCRALGVITPEDEYPIWETEQESFVVAPLFLLYDYSFRLPEHQTVEQGLAYANEVGLVFTDEHLLHPDPYPTRQDWCAARVEATERRLAALPADLRTVLITHFPLHRGPTTMLRYPHLAMWCGTERTADWHLRFRAAVAVYGHLHIPVTLEYDGVRFEEVSLGYPREWQRRSAAPNPIRRILPADPSRVPYNAVAR